MGENTSPAKLETQSAHERTHYDTPTVNVIPLDQILFGGTASGADFFGNGRPS
jgi:hypothetical protein